MIALVAALAVVVVLGVGFRKAGAALVWYDEAASILLAWLTYYGAALVALTRGHIGVPVLVERLRGDRLEPLRGNRHRGQGARADAPGSEHRADPAHHALPAQRGEAPQHLAGVAAEIARDLRERRLADGKAALVLVEEAPVQRVEDRKVRIRGARHGGGWGTDSRGRQR